MTTTSLFDITGKVIVVTGATGALTGCAADYLATQGARVVYLGRTQAKLDASLEKIRAACPEAEVMGTAANINDRASLEAARDAILDSLPVLRGRLADQGFEIANFQVEVADNNADAANSGNQQETPFGQPGQSGSGQRSPVDYRRLAAQGRRHQSELAAGGPPGTVHLSPTSLASLDLQA